MEHLSDLLNSAIAKLFAENPTASDLISDFRKRVLIKRGLLILGGLLRDILIFQIHSRYIPLQDIDLVIYGDYLDKNTMVRFFEGHRSVTNVSDNNLGGITVHLPEPCPKIGLWHINDTRSLVLQNKKRTIDELLNNVIFSMNAISIDLESRDTFESGAIAAIENQLLDFKSKFIHDEEVQVARALWYEFKLKFHLSPAVENFVRSAFSKNKIDDAISQVLKDKAGDKYGVVIERACEKYIKMEG